MADIGLCQCGCGNKTKIRKFQRRGFDKGAPTKFLPGHQQKLRISSCAVNGCTNKMHARGLCRLHYMRKWHAGDVFADKPPQKGVIDISGKKFNRWTVTTFDRIDKKSGALWKCICDCGTHGTIRGSSLRTGGSKSCGCLVSDIRKQAVGPLARNWKGGTRTNHGYKMIRSYGHPNGSKGGYVFEHRKIMSDLIGRPLERHELVHHKNGMRDDNRIENLELLTHSTHMGEIECPHCQKKFQIK